MEVQSGEMGKAQEHRFFLAGFKSFATEKRRSRTGAPVQYGVFLFFEDSSYFTKYGV
jgi:hypothetical protein